MAATSSVRAKFICHTKDSGSIVLHAVGGDSPENQAFFAATPNGQVILYVVNPDAAAHFEPGKQYYLDFTDASEAAG